MPSARILPILLLSLFALSASAVTITFDGTIGYGGSSVGDSLYVAVLDTTGVEDVTLLDVQVYEINGSPFTQPYTLTFDNDGVATQLLIAAFLDVDGGGLADISGLDVFGWYDGNFMPQAVSSASSQSNLDFELPTGEIHGTVTFGPGQVEARVDVSQDLSCMMEGFRPGAFLFGTGTYSIIGVYAGSYCVSAEGQLDSGYQRICFGDVDCLSATSVNVGEGESVNGVNLDFSVITHASSSSWGSLKARF